MIIILRWIYFFSLKFTCILKSCLEWFTLYGTLKFINHYVIPHLINDIVVYSQFNMIIWTYKKWHIHKNWATLACNHLIICLYEEPFHTSFSCFPWSHLQVLEFLPLKFGVTTLATTILVKCEVIFYMLCLLSQILVGFWNLTPLKD